MKLRRLMWTMTIIGLSAGLLLSMWPLGAQAQRGTWQWENPLPQGNDPHVAAMIGADTCLGNVFAGYGMPNTSDGTDQDLALVYYNLAETPTFSLNVTPASLNVCAPADAVYSVDVGSILGFSDPVTLSGSGNPAGTTVNFSVNPVPLPGSSTLTIGDTGAAAPGSYSIDVTGTANTDTEHQAVELNLYTAAPAAPALLTPADGAVDVSFEPTFAWTAVAQAASYLLEVATDAGFTNIVYTASEVGTSHLAAVPLSAATTHYWRVTAGNVCGAGTSTTFSFTTQAVTMACNSSAVDFEDGIPPDWTVVDNTGGTGIVWVTTADPACEIPNRTNGTGEAACADSDAAGYPAIPYDTELVSNPFDLSAVGAAVLDVKAYYRDITTGANDRFEVDVWDGVGWTNELSWDEDHMPEDFSLNLSAYAGLPTVQVRFRYFGNGYDWYAQVDDIALTCVPMGPPVIEVDPAALTAAQGPAVVSTQPMTVTNSGGNPLNWSIAEDDTACDSPTDIPWLSVAPDTGTTLPLDSTVVDVTFDSTVLAPGYYTANLCVNSNDPATSLVQVPVALTVEPPELLACNGDMIQFEDGIPSGWTVVDNTGGTGIVWVTTADPACEIPNRTNGSGEAACADSDAAGFPAIPYDTELWSPLIDLSGQGAVVLDVKAYYRDITTGANDRFEVDVWDGVGWTNELSWDEDHEPEDFSLNLSAYAGVAGVRVRFRYFGNGYDWYAQVDDVALTCVPSGPPVIEVDPAALTAAQGPGVVSTQPITVTNSGGSTLNWSIVEDDTACDSPTDISWLSVAPDTGTTVPLDSTVVDVTFDSMGLALGNYMANLCVDSDAPATPLVQVPVTLTVESPVGPPVINCPADVTIECDESSGPDNTGYAMATGNCGTPMVTYADVEYLSGCNGTGYIERTWTATDDCGNTATCVQIITVADTTPPVISPPADVTIECDESSEPETTGWATATDNCGKPTVTYVDVGSVNGCNGTGTIQRTWTATDDCGNSSSAVQLIRKACIAIEKTTADDYGNEGDGVGILPGQNVTWNYYVTNDGSVPLENVTVTDDQGIIPVFDSEISGDGDVVFEPCEVWLYTAAGTAVDGWYYNTGTASGDCIDDGGDTLRVTDTDDSSYFGLAPGAVTDSSLCDFGDNFNLIFTPDLQNGNRHKLSGSNPGQFFYNMFYTGDPGSPFEVTLPYPFVTHGSMAVHAYSGVFALINGAGETCFVPAGEGIAYDYDVTLASYDEGGFDCYGDTYVLTLAEGVPTNGFVYLNVHLDYGLKHTNGWQKSRDHAFNDPVINPDLECVDILHLSEHTFSSTLSDSADPIYNVNAFKRLRGFGGLVTDEDSGDPVEGATVEVWHPVDGLVDTATTDEHGWYLTTYIHKGNETTYTVILLNTGEQQQVTVGKKVKFGEADFTIS